jgi:hypothetical protein
MNYFNRSLVGAAACSFCVAVLCGCRIYWKGDGLCSPQPLPLDPYSFHFSRLGDRFFVEGSKTSQDAQCRYWTLAFSRMSEISRRTFSSSFKRSGVASISAFFQTNTSPAPRFSRTLTFPSTI